MEEELDFRIDKIEHNITQLKTSLEIFTKENVILTERIKELEMQLFSLREHVDWVYEEAQT